MREVQLFIKGSPTSDYVKVDLFSDENISLTQTIKNAQDVSKIFTDFSKSFTIPASKTNNNIFKHYEKFVIDNGFDARKRVDARIEINRIPFKYGRVRLDGVELKDGIANAYKITFFGNTIKLKDTIGEDKLSALNFPLDYNKVYGQAEVKAALQLDPSSNDVIVPLITHSQRLTYGSNTGANTGDLKPGGNNGVLWSELKYAIRVDAVVQAIADKYGFTYSADSFFNHTVEEPNLPYYNLFMWLHRKKGNVGSDILSTADFSLISGFTGNTDPNEFVWRNTDGSQIIIEQTRFLTTFEVSIANPSGTNYSISIRRDGIERISQQNVTSTNLTIDVLTEARDGSDYEVYLSADAATSFTFTWTATLEEDGNAPQLENFSVTKTAGTDPAFNISEQIPEMKVMDFLSALFRMFNLVATVDENNVVTVKTLDKYYESGVVRDITKYTHNDSGSVDSAIPYAEINLKYKDTETILAKQFDQLKNREWGSDTYNTEDGLKEGGTFSLELPFSHMQYERLPDISTGNLTNVMYGYFVDDNQDPYLGAPLVFYPILNSLGSYPISYVTTTDANGDFTATETITTSVIIPSNALYVSEYVDTDNIHFFPEASEYYPNYAPFKTLFYNYHWNYVASLFNFRKRMTKIKATLPVNFLINYSLADILLFKGLPYRINSINTSLTTGESSLELLNVVNVSKPVYDGAYSTSTTIQPPTTTVFVPTTIAPTTVFVPTTQSPPTTLAPGAAYIDVYARTPLEAVGITLQYSVNGNPYQSAGSGAVNSSCGLLATVSGLQSGDSVVIRVVGTTTGINYPINGDNSTTCPTSIAGASGTLNYGTVSVGLNNLALIIDNVPTIYTQQLGYRAAPFNEDAAYACAEYNNNIFTTVYTNGNNLLNTSSIYATVEGLAYATDTGWYSDGVNAIYWNGTFVDGEVGCAGQTTVAPTTADPSNNYSLVPRGDNQGWVLATDACNSVGGTGSIINLHYSKNDAITVGTVLYTDNALQNVWNGGSRWYQDGGQVVYVDDAGVIGAIQGCVPTTQAPTTQAPTTQSPTTIAPTTQAPSWDCVQIGEDFACIERFDGSGQYSSLAECEGNCGQAPTTQVPTTQVPTTTVAISCTEYEIDNYGSSSVTFSYQDCATGTTSNMTVSPIEPGYVCARTGTLQYVSGTFDYSVTNLGPC